MKILQLNCVYNQGSTGKIVENISRELLAQGHDVISCYGSGDVYYDDHSKKICGDFEHKLNALWGRVSGIPFGGVYFSNFQIQRIIKKFNPDIVHVHCVNGYMMNVYSLFHYLAKHHIKTVLTLHAEIFHTAGCGHAYECDKWKIKCCNCERYKQFVGSWFFDRSYTSWKKMFNAVNSFSKNDLIITAVSPWLTDRASQSSIMKSYNVECVLNGIDTDIFHYRENSNLINHNGFNKVVLFVTPYFSLDEIDIKGGRYLYPIAHALPNVKFIVAASRLSDNLGVLPSNVQIWGQAKNQDELARLYSDADITLLLSRRETFSMVAAESLCCGTPVVGFKAGGPESIAIDDYATFVDYGDVASLVDLIQQESVNSDIRKDKSKYYIERFDSKQMVRCYYKIFQDLSNTNC